MTAKQREDIAKLIRRYREEIVPMIEGGHIELRTPPPLRKNRTDDRRGVPFEGKACVCELIREQDAVRLTFDEEGVRLKNVLREA